MSSSKIRWVAYLNAKTWPRWIYFWMVLVFHSRYNILSEAGNMEVEWWESLGLPLSRTEGDYIERRVGTRRGWESIFELDDVERMLQTVPRVRGWNEVWGWLFRLFFFSSFASPPQRCLLPLFFLSYGYKPILIPWWSNARNQAPPGGVVLIYRNRYEDLRISNSVQGSRYEGAKIRAKEERRMMKTEWASEREKKLVVGLYRAREAMAWSKLSAIFHWSRAFECKIIEIVYSAVIINKAPFFSSGCDLLTWTLMRRLLVRFNLSSGGWRKKHFLIKQSTESD